MHIRWRGLTPDGKDTQGCGFWDSLTEAYDDILRSGNHPLLIEESHDCTA